MPEKNNIHEIVNSNMGIIKRFFGYALLIAGLGVLLMTILRGIIGYQDGMFSFTESEYLTTVADVQSGFLPLIEPQDNKGFSQVDVTDEAEFQTPENDENVTVTQEADDVEIPDHIPINIKIEVIDLDVEIIPVEKMEIIIDDVGYHTWEAPEEVVGWQYYSAQLGRTGNTVLIGHHNSSGSVFKNLKDIVVGDRITISSEDQDFEYKVKDIMILLEKEQPLEVRLENAKWLWATLDERVTLVTCWPKYDNSHRLIIVAIPIDD